MRRSITISSLALGSTLAVGSFMLTPSFAGDKRTAQAGERQWLSIQKILDKLEAAGYRDFEKIEREHGDYEVRAPIATANGPSSMSIRRAATSLDQAGRGKRDKADDDRRQRGSAFADCNERRCRDDLPQKIMPPAPAAK